MKALLDATIVAGGIVCLMYLTACGGADKTPDKTGDKPGDKPVAVDRSALCADLCDHAESASCENYNPNCDQACKGALDLMPVRCDVALKAAFDCYVEQPVTCDDEGSPVFTGCENKDVAVDACLSAEEPQGEEVDPTYGGRCLPGSSTPENSASHCGSLPNTPKLYECSGGPPKAGCVNDPFEGHHLYCCPA